MSKHARYALLPVIAALVLAVAPAEAVSVGSQGASVQQPFSKSPHKQQGKLHKQCAKLAAGKIKQAKKRAKYQKLCGASAAPGQGGGPVLGGGAGNEAPGSEAGIPDGSDGASDGDSNPGGDYVDEILDLPPVFTPPAGVPALPAPELDALPPTTNDVPEPGSLALLGLGLMGLGLARRRK